MPVIGTSCPGKQESSRRSSARQRPDLAVADLLQRAVRQRFLRPGRRIGIKAAAGFESSASERRPCGRLRNALSVRSAKNISKRHRSCWVRRPQRLLTCMLNRDQSPRTSSSSFSAMLPPLQRYSEQSNRIRVLCTACAVIRKYHNDRAQKEEWTMDWMKEKDDRSYQSDGCWRSWSMWNAPPTAPRKTGSQTPSACSVQRAPAACGKAH